MTSGWMRRDGVDVDITAGCSGTFDEILDGEKPRDAQHVIEMLKEAGSKRQAVEEWSLDDSLTINVMVTVDGITTGASW